MDLSINVEVLQSDFEKALITSLKKINNPNIKVLRCMFHYIKAIWNKLNKLYLKKINIINTIIT